MSIPLSFTSQDLKAATLVDPGKYRAKITSVKQEASKDKTSMNIVIQMEISAASNPKFVGVPLRHYISEKALMMPINQHFFQALGCDLEKDPNVDAALAKGKDIGVEVVRGSYNNNPQNTVQDFFPADLV